MQKMLFLFLGLVCSISGNTQSPLEFSELGGDPAYCRINPCFQTGNGVVYAAATGGVPDYEYKWRGPLEPLYCDHLDSTNNTTWGGLNAGCYEITVTDAVGSVIIDTVCIDSINPIADFNVLSADLFPYSDGWYGFGYPVAHFENESQNYANPINPIADTIFYWNFKNPDAWYVSEDVHEALYYGYPEGTYDVELVTLNKNGCADSVSKTITVFPPLSTGEFTGKGLFVITPDSEDQLIRIKLGGLENANLMIYDLTGRLIIEEYLTEDESVISFGEENGIYVYRLASSELEDVIGGKFNF